MKKFIAFSIVFTLLAAAVFAEVTVTGGASLSFIPIGAIIPDEGDTEIGAGLGRNGDANTNIDVNITGVTESGKAGFQFQWRPRLIGKDLDLSGMGDFAGLWIKPLDWIRIDAGKFVNNDIQGRLSSGAWLGDYTLPRPGEGDIFTNISTNAGILVALKPAAVEGLGVYVGVKDINTPGKPSLKNHNPWGVNRGIGYVYENTQVAVSYAIPNIGLARAQYVGAHPAVKEDPAGILPSTIYSITAPKIEAAFAYTGVSNLTIDVGGKFSLPVTDPKTEETVFGKDDGTETKGTFKAPIVAALGVKYVAGSLTATFIVDGKFAGSYQLKGTDAIDLGIEIRPWVTVNYKINDTFTAQAEGGIVYAGDSEQDGKVVATGGVRYGFGAALQTTFAPSCTLRTGITYAGGEGVQEGKEALKLPGVFSVPFIFAVSF
jgi:hypothetical protein